jgi:hypothetical protein
MLLFAAHQGEEFVLALPAILLVGAFFIMRWANQGDEPAENESAEKSNTDEISPEEEEALVKEATQSRRRAR